MTSLDVLTTDITLISTDHKEFIVDREIFSQSEFIQTLLECDASTESISLQVESKYLGRLIDYMIHHHKNPSKSIEKPLTKPFEELVDTWDANFLDIPLDNVIHLLTASNYLGIMPLVNIICAKIASLLKSDKVDIEQLKSYMG